MTGAEGLSRAVLESGTCIILAATLNMLISLVCDFRPSLAWHFYSTRKDPEIIRPNHDLTSQLTSRKDRLSWLIRFINDNAALRKMSQRSRQRLATDAEKLYACHQLWLKMNEHLECALNPIYPFFFLPL